LKEKKLLLQEWVIIFIVLSSIGAVALVTKIKKEKLKIQIQLEPIGSKK